jgi:hypothetical protein
MAGTTLKLFKGATVRPGAAGAGAGGKARRRPTPPHVKARIAAYALAAQAGRATGLTVFAALPPGDPGDDAA